MESRNEKNIYTYFNYNRDLIECVYKITPIKIKEIFKKKWGPYLVGTISGKLSSVETEIFMEYANWFESKLQTADELYLSGYRLKEISDYLVSGKEKEKKAGISKTKEVPTQIKIYPKLEDVLTRYHTKRNDLDSILEHLPKEQKISFIYFYGIDRSQYSMHKIASILDQNGIVLGCTEEAVKKYIVSVYKILESQNKKKENTRVKSLKKVIPIKIYKGEEDVLQEFHFTEDELNQYMASWVEEQEKCFRYVNGIGRPKMSVGEVAQFLNCDEEQVRIYLNLANADLENKKATLHTSNDNMVIPVNNRKKKNKNSSRKSIRLKMSLYDGYIEEDRKYVTEVIENWKLKNPPYYELIAKVYGPTYDHLNIEIYYQLTKEEKETLRVIKTGLTQAVNNRKKNNANNSRKSNSLKTSLYDGYIEENRKYVTEVIERWKLKNPPYYELIVKVYGPTYDHLNIEIYYQLTKEEKETLRVIKTGLTKAVNKRKKKVQSNSKSVGISRSSNIESKVESHNCREIESSTILPKSKKEILIKDIFSDEILEIGKIIYMQMQDQDVIKQKNAAYVREILERISNKSITDKVSLYQMIHLICELNVAPIDEEILAKCIKKMQQ